MAEADGLALWVKLIPRLCPLRHQSSSEPEASRVPRDGDGIARGLALVQKVYCRLRQPRATITLNQAAN
jgi:hypothetical protein